jgi:hypothetical protein
MQPTGAVNGTAAPMAPLSPPAAPPSDPVADAEKALAFKSRFASNLVSTDDRVMTYITSAEDPRQIGLEQERCSRPTRGGRVPLGVSTALAEEQDIASAGANQISLAEAREMILASLKPLGPDYARRFGALLDPANGRLDLEGGNHRAETGTSISAYDVPTALYYQGYQGSLRDVSKIAHEGGHTIHRELMNSSGLPVYEREGPHYLFESYAIFNELLLLDQATRSATTPAAREYALERLLSKIAGAVCFGGGDFVRKEPLYTGRGSRDAGSREGRCYLSELDSAV